MIIADNSLQALIRHQNQRNRNMSPVPAPICNRIWKACRAFSNHKDTTLARRMRPTVEARATET